MENILGIDIGGTNIKFAIVQNAELKSEIIQIKTPENLENFQVELSKTISDIIKKYSAVITKIGISVPGLVDHKNSKIIHCPNLSYLDNTDFSFISNDNFLVKIGNDADLALVAEVDYGDLQNLSVALFNIGTGVGGAYYSNGHFNFKTRMSAEFGHIKVAAHGEKCGCGQEGCLEAYFSGLALTAKGQKFINPEIGEANEIFELVDIDDRATEIINSGAYYLGLAISNVINIIGSDVVIIGGKISLGLDCYIETLIKTLEENVFQNGIRNIQIRKSNLVDKASIIGATLMF